MYINNFINNTYILKVKIRQTLDLQIFYISLKFINKYSENITDYILQT